MTSVIAQAALRHGLPDVPGREVIACFGYSIGFLMVILGRMQLFTEQTIVTVLPVMAQPTWRKLWGTARLWTIVFVANMLGTFVAAGVNVKLRLVSGTCAWTDGQRLDAVDPLPAPAQGELQRRQVGGVAMKPPRRVPPQGRRTALSHPASSKSISEGRCPSVRQPTVVPPPTRRTGPDGEGRMSSCRERSQFRDPQQRSAGRSPSRSAADWRQQNSLVLSLEGVKKQRQDNDDRQRHSKQPKNDGHFPLL